MASKVPEVRFKGFNGEWEEKSLGTVANLGSSKRIHRDEYVESGIPFFRGSEISKLGKASNLKDILFISEENYAEIKEKYGVPQIGDILITAVGTLANSFLISDETPFYFKDGNLIWLSNIETDSQYLSVYISDGIGKSKILESAAGSNQKALTMVKLQKVMVPVPRPVEQTLIGNFFKKLDERIVIQRQELEALKSTKQGFLQKIFPAEGESVPQLRFPGFSGEWEEKMLGDIGETFSGLSGKSKEDFGHGEAKYITYMNIFSNTIASIDGTEQIEIDDRQNQVEYGDVFFTTSSETPEEVGMSSIWLEKDEAHIYLNSFCIGYRPHIEIMPYYLAFLLRSPSIRKKFIILAQGISRYNISKKRVMDLSIPIPSIEEQTLIGNFFKNLDDTIAQHNQELDALEQTKKAFLQKMFV